MVAIVLDFASVRTMNWRTPLLTVGTLVGSVVVIELLASVLTEAASR